MTFRVGQKVVCIKGGTTLVNGFVPITGSVYTIRGFFLGPVAGEPRVLLAEYIHPEKFEGVEIGWNALRFRPVVERKTSISVFEAMLTKTGVDA